MFYTSDFYINSILITLVVPPIQPVLSVRDLGVTVDHDLKFHGHTSLVTNKAKRILGLFKRSFACLDSDMLVRLYKSMVQPILEYANVIWGPYYLMDQRKVEAIQLT